MCGGSRRIPGSLGPPRTSEARLIATFPVQRRSISRPNTDFFRSDSGRNRATNPPWTGNSGPRRNATAAMLPPCSHRRRILAVWGGVASADAVIVSKILADLALPSVPQDSCHRESKPEALALLEAGAN
jgi:hypothetical protein